MEPLVSVIMPVYNTPEPILREAIESILNQTFKNFEFIIIDDCSKKSIQPIVDSYCDNRVIFLRNKENLGVTGAPNVGLDNSRGVYIARMDSDDIAHPDRLKMQVDFLENNQDIDILGTAFEKFPKKKIVRLPLDDKAIKLAMIFNYNAICHPSVMIRKSTIDKLKIRYEKKHEVCEDYGVWLKYINDVKFANLNDVLLKYRWNGNNISKRKTKLQSANTQMLMFKAQGEYFGVDYKPAIEVVAKCRDDKIVISSDLIVMNDFIKEIKNKLKSAMPECQYSVNRNFYKTFLKKCVSDISFIQILFSKELNDIIKLSLFEKLGMIIGI